MTPTNGKEKNIFVRDLKPKDRKMLAELRKDFSTSYNTVAVMKACYQHFQDKGAITTLKGEKAKLNRQIDATRSELQLLKAKIEEYFNDIDKAEKRKMLLASDLRKAGKAQPKQGKKGLGYLMDEDV